MVAKKSETTEENVETTSDETIKDTSMKQLAYVGPSFKGVSHCTVFIGDLPGDLTEAQKACSAFKRLVVELAEYGKAQDELSQKDSIVFVSYKEACEYLKSTKQEGGK